MNMPTRSIATLAAALLCLAPAVTAQAAKIYRCGPDGRIYSQTPCKDGHEINAADKRSAEQRKAAEDSVKREGQTTEKMARERQANEAAAAKQGAIMIANPAAAKAVPATPDAASAPSGKDTAAKKNGGSSKAVSAKHTVGAKADKKP